MYRQGFRRLGIIFGGILAVTVVLSALFGAAAGEGIQRSVALGLYISGALFLIGCFVFGARGPLRGESGEGQTVPIMGARRVRRATTDERSEATRTALLLFALGVVLVFLAAIIDPAHKAF